MASTSTENQIEHETRDTHQSADRRDAQTSFVKPPCGASVTESDTSTVADLFRELQETNRLLRELVSQKTVEQPPLEAPEPHLQPATDGPSAADTNPGEPSSPDQEILVKTWRLVDGLARAAFGELNEKIGLWKAVRERIISCTYHKPDHTNQDRLFVHLTDWPASRSTWARDPPAEPTRDRIRIPEGTVPLTDHEKEQLRRQWPLQFDLDTETGRIRTTGSGWILGQRAEPGEDLESALAGFLCGCPLLSCRNNEVATANTILTRSKFVAAMTSSGDLISPGCLWYAVPHSHSAVWYPALGQPCACRRCLHDEPHDDDHFVYEFLHQFCAAWMPLYLRERRWFNRFYGFKKLDQYGIMILDIAAFQHHIRCFSVGTEGYLSNFDAYISCHRETGELPALPGAPVVSFAERRMSVYCWWSYSDDEPYFKIVLVSDLRSLGLDPHRVDDTLAKWKERGFTVRGENAGYHLLQSTIHYMLSRWENEWSACLEALGNAVKTKLDDILSDELSAQLMFDSSYARSRVYFKTLEILRIFADMIRETGRDLQEMNAEPLLRGSVLIPGQAITVRTFVREDPTKDQALRKNWQVLSEFQKEAESRLLQKISEMTEEIKSLRDGLFNATSLREASRSTTMNRYIIVFTIMTVIYLPLSFTASLFSTPLFEGQPGISGQFTTSTVLTCFITYVLAVFLVWAADKWDAARSLYRQVRSLGQLMWTQVRRRVAVIVGSKRSNEVPENPTGMMPAGV